MDWLIKIWTKQNNRKMICEQYLSITDPEFCKKNNSDDDSCAKM